MNQDHFTSQQKYLYMDSSQQQTDQTQLNNELNMSDLSYVDSSSNDQYNQQNNYQAYSEKHTNNKNYIKPQSKKLYHVKSDEFLLRDQYLVELQRIIKENQQKILKKTPLLLPNTDKEILSNLQKRNKNYGYFLKTLQVDKKYNQIISNKTQKLKKQNQRKKIVLNNKKLKSTLRKEQNQMKKYVLDKKLKQQIVIDKIQKYAYKLGIQRIRNEQKKVKTQVKQIVKHNELKVTNLDIKQRNQIQELRQELQKMKQTNRVNKVDLKKTFKQMEVDNSNDKKFIVSKTQSLKQKRFVI